MHHYPSNILLHESIFSKNYDHPHRPHTHPTNTPALTLYTINPPDPAASGHPLPLYYLPPAPQLVLSRPGTQQDGPIQYSPNCSTNAEYDAQYSHSVLPSLHPDAHHKPSAHPEGYGYPSLHSHASCEPFAAHAHPEGYSHHLSLVSPDWQQWNPNYFQPPYILSALYNSPVHLWPPCGNPVYERPVYESMGLYGVYTQPKGHARSHMDTRASSLHHLHPQHPTLSST